MFNALDDNLAALAVPTWFARLGHAYTHASTSESITAQNLTLEATFLAFVARSRTNIDNKIVREHKKMKFPFCPLKKLYVYVVASLLILYFIILITCLLYCVGLCWIVLCVVLCVVCCVLGVVC